MAMIKVFKHIINICNWAIISIYIFTILFIQIPTVQVYIGSEMANIISDKFGTKVSINRINLGVLNRIIIDDVLIYDQQGKEMIKAARLTAKIDLIPLLEGKISISSAQMFGANINLYKKTAQSKANYQFVLDSLSSKDTTTHAPLNIRVNSLIIRRSSIVYDQHDKETTPGKINAGHLKITDLSAHIILKSLKEDSLNANIKRIAFKEQSGLNVKKLSFKINAGKSLTLLQKLQLDLPNTKILLGNCRATYKTINKKPVLTSLSYSGYVDALVIPADISCFEPKLNRIKNTIYISAEMQGSNTNLQLKCLNLRSKEKGIKVLADGWIKNWDAKPNWNINIKDMEVAGDVISNILQSLNVGSPQLHNVISQIGEMKIQGALGASNSKALSASCKFVSNAGVGDLLFSLSKDSTFKSTLNVQALKLDQILNNKQLGNFSAGIDINGTLIFPKVSSLSLKGNINEFDYNKYKYNNISFNGTYDYNKIFGMISMDDPNASLKLTGSYEKNDKYKNDVIIKADVKCFKPQAINLTDKWGNANFAVSLDADLKASGFDDANGNINITDFQMKSPTDTFFMKRACIKAGFDNNEHYLTFDNDFANAKLTGKFKYNTIAQSFINFVGDKLPTLPGLPQVKKTVYNNFIFNANIKSMEWLEKLFKIPLKANAPIIIYTKVDDYRRDIAVNCHFDNIQYDNKQFRDGKITMKSSLDTLSCNIGTTQVLENGSKIEIDAICKASNNNLSTVISWNNQSLEDFKGKLYAVSQFYKNTKGIPVASIDILPSHIDIGDVRWNITRSNIIYSKNDIEIKNFTIRHKDQHIILNGKATANESDSMFVYLKGIDVNYVLNLIDFHSVKFSGLATGRAYITAPFGDTYTWGNILVKNFKFEDGRMGVLNATVKWNKKDKQIDINAIANDGPDAMTYIDGYVSPSRNCIDLNIDAAGTHIDFMESYTESFMNNVKGHANGNVRIIGPLKRINLIGQLIVNGETVVTPTNCKYYLRNDTIEFIPNEIKINNAAIYDIYNNKGILKGSIYHKYLKDLSYDLNVGAENLLGYDFNDYGDNNFCGTVYASGNVGIHGEEGEVNIDISITPQANSIFIYNASNPDAVADQAFIKWNDVTPHDKTILKEDTRQNEQSIDITTDTHINFLLNCTPDITIKLLTDSRTNDCIILNGSGVLTATYYNKGSFNLFGTYIVQHGTYGITIQDLIKKNFIFNDGSSIIFRGNPYMAELNLQAVHTINSVSLSDLNVGNSFTNNMIRVNCLMNITGQPQKPTISFDLDMPTVSSDEKQLIRSIINSEDEMNQQVLYLLGIGRFYPKRENNSIVQNDGQQSQTALAMQGILSGTISTQINNVLNTVIKSNKWNFGANISTGDEGWNNAEYEGLLSGRLLNNRLLINGQFGYRDNANTASTNFIGDFDIRYLLKPNGNLSIKVYNQTNDRYFTNSSLNTQGIGIIMKKDFNGLNELLKFNKKSDTEK